MKTRFVSLVMATLVVSLLSLSSSCDKMILNDEGVSDLKKVMVNAASSTTIAVNWDNWTDGDHYNVAMARADFGDINGFTQLEQARTLISLSRLRVTLLKDEYGANGGVITNSRIDTLETYELNYKVKFHADFDFATTGRLGFGFQIGDGADGVADGEGGTFRLAWDTDANGDSYFKPYAYYADQPGTAGDDFGARFPASGGLMGSVWYNVKMVIKANTKMDRNGRAELYINDVEVLNIPIRWTKDHTKRKINQLLCSNYRAGAGSESTRNANVWFDDFTLEGTTPTYAPTWCDSVYAVTSHYDTVSATHYQLTEIKTSGDIRLRNALADKTEGETGTEFARRMDCCVAFNASMGKSDLPTGVREPVGVQIVDGDIVQDLPSIRYTLGIKAGNELLAYAPGEIAANMLADGANDALTAFTPLIENHEPVPQSVLDAGPPNYKIKNPRQVIAQRANGDILMLSCGGRGYGGEGMLATDLIRILSEQNVRFAFNLDGGGSVTTMVNGERITPLIDGHGTLERTRPNWLYVKYDHGD